MRDAAQTPVRSDKGARKKRKPLAKRIWRAVRQPLASSAIVKNALAATITAALRLVDRTNRRVAGSDDIQAVLARSTPGIFVFWHGQHLMGACLTPTNYPFVALVSRSADAELNALVTERFSIPTVRGSGGRDRTRTAEKGGARALIALKKALDAGKSVVMIADIPHGTPRESGLGVVTLARISGRPVIPVAIATSRRKVLERSWDKTTINLPFGRLAVLFGDPILIAADAGDAGMEACRQAITDGLEAVNHKAYRLVDGSQ